MSATEYIAGPVSAEGIQRINALQSLANQSQVQVFDANASNRRMLFFAFDGTGNNKDNTAEPRTNVAELFDAAEAGLTGSGVGKAFYYAGPGTQQSFPLTRVLDLAIGYTVPTTAVEAYNRLIDYANANPNQAITIGTTGFSRGAATARAFLNLVWEAGIPDTSSPMVSKGIDPQTGQAIMGYSRYLVEPHQADLGIAVLFDTVATGTAREAQYLAIPPAPGLQVYQPMAQDEHRGDFKPDSAVDPLNPTDPRIHEWWGPGAHSDIGGGYVGDALSRRYLNIAASLIRNSGVPIGEVPPPTDGPLVIHDSFKGMHGPNTGPETGGYVVEPRETYTKHYNNQSTLVGRAIQVFDDGSRIETLTFADRSTQTIERNGSWAIVRSTTVVTHSDGSVFSREIDMRLPDGRQQIERYDASNTLTSTTQIQVFSDGSRMEETRGANGTVEYKVMDDEGAVSHYVAAWHTANGYKVHTQFMVNGETATQTTGVTFSAVATPDGSFTLTDVTAVDGQTSISMPSGMGRDEMRAYLSNFPDVRSLLSGRTDLVNDLQDFTASLVPFSLDGPIEGRPVSGQPEPVQDLPALGLTITRQDVTDAYGSSVILRVVNSSGVVINTLTARPGGEPGLWDAELTLHGLTSLVSGQPEDAVLRVQVQVQGAGLQDVRLTRILGLGGASAPGTQPETQVMDEALSNLGLSAIDLLLQPGLKFAQLTCLAGPLRASLQKQEQQTTTRCGLKACFASKRCTGRLRRRCSGSSTRFPGLLGFSPA